MFTVRRTFLVAAAFLAACGSTTPPTPPETKHTLLVQKSGTGSGTVTGEGIDCGSTCSASFREGASVTLTATADRPGLLAGWSGCDTAEGERCTVAMSEDRSVTATFKAPSGCAARATRKCSQDPSGNGISWPTGSPLGTCHQGTQTCTMEGGIGTWGPCVGPVAPAARDCTSALDHDCDGVPDNTHDAVCQCQREDNPTCVGNPGFPGSTCPGTRACQLSSASSSWGPCNGPQYCECTTDQPCTAGQCSGTRPCNNGHWGACEFAGQPLPADCECLASEPCTAGQCAGTRPCTNGHWGACEAGGQALPADCECLTGTRSCGGPNCQRTLSCTAFHFPACNNPPNCQCTPGQHADCSTERGYGNAKCGTAICTAAFTWNDSNCKPPVPWCRDRDGDGHGDPATTQNMCCYAADGICGEPPASGYVKVCDDCNDSNNTLYPGAACGLAGYQAGFTCTPGVVQSNCACSGGSCGLNGLGFCAMPSCNSEFPCPAGYWVPSAASCQATWNSGNGSWGIYMLTGNTGCGFHMATVYPNQLELSFVVTCPRK